MLKKYWWPNEVSTILWKIVKVVSENEQSADLLRRKLLYPRRRRGAKAWRPAPGWVDPGGRLLIDLSRGQLYLYRCPAMSRLGWLPTAFYAELHLCAEKLSKNWESQWMCKRWVKNVKGVSEKWTLLNLLRWKMVSTALGGLRPAPGWVDPTVGT